MSAWAYRCRGCDEKKSSWFVSELDVERLGSEVQIVRVRVDADWQCAVLDRSQRVAVDKQLLRDVIASDEADCPECAALLAAAAGTPGDAAMEPAPITDSADRPSGAENPLASESTGQHGRTLQAAAISLQGEQFVVVVTSRSLVTSPGEADMAIDDLQKQFGGVPVVLMAQRDDGAPSYFGDSRLVDLLADVPIERMPWKEYRIG
jgi:hypothetical protein